MSFSNFLIHGAQGLLKSSITQKLPSRGDG
jgi:hypothetical protein